MLTARVVCWWLKLKRQQKIYSRRHASGGSRGSAFAVSEEEHVAETAGNGLVYRFVKRAFDIAFSLCVVVVGLAPIALLLLIIRLESPGSPIYRQERIGYRGQPLRIFKLRTMVADSDDVEKHLSPEQLAQWRSERKVEDDPRVTRVGRFLRRTSLDRAAPVPQRACWLYEHPWARVPWVADELPAYGTDVDAFLSMSPASPAGGRFKQETMQPTKTAVANNLSCTTCGTRISNWTWLYFSKHSNPSSTRRGYERCLLKWSLYATIRRAPSKCESSAPYTPALTSI